MNTYEYPHCLKILICQARGGTPVTKEICMTCLVLYLNQTYQYRSGKSCQYICMGKSIKHHFCHRRNHIQGDIELVLSTLDLTFTYFEEHP